MKKSYQLVELLSRFGEAPMDTPDSYKNKIMHATFSFGDYEIMASDAMPGEPANADSNIHLSIDVPDETELQPLFTKLSEGGRVTMPLADTFWGATFGMLVDKFGIKWMFNHDKKKD